MATPKAEACPDDMATEACPDEMATEVRPDEMATITPMPLPQATLETWIKEFKSLSAVSSLKAVECQSIEHNSDDLSRLGVRENYSWHDVAKDAELIRSRTSDENQRVKTVLLVRHAEGHHNDAEKRLGKEYWENVEAKKDEYFDSDLNEKGEAQCEALRESFESALENGLKVDLIVVSPLTRAIQTAKLSMPQLFTGEKRVPIVSMEWCREHFGKNTPDKRRSVSELKEKYPMIDFDNFMVGEEDPWWTPVRETDEEVNKRVEQFFSWLMSSPDNEVNTVIVVGHSSYMAHAIEYVGMPYHWPSNCEVTPVVVQATYEQKDSV